MELSAQVLNRTLLDRQHLLARTPRPCPRWSSISSGCRRRTTSRRTSGSRRGSTTFDPYDVTRGLEDRSLVRLLTMRSTVHLLVADDALMLRQFTRPIHERERKVSQMVRPAIDVDLDEFTLRSASALSDGPLPVKTLGEALAERFPGVPPNALGPPGPGRGSRSPSCRRVAAGSSRAAWSTSSSTLAGASARRARPGGDRAPLPAAYGPASAADVTAWSGVTRLGRACSASMDDLVRHDDETGKKLSTCPPATIADADVPAPCGCSAPTTTSGSPTPAATASPIPRSASAGWASTAGSATTVFVDGWLEGLWRVEDGRPVGRRALPTLYQGRAAPSSTRSSTAWRLLAR